MRNGRHLEKRNALEGMHTSCVTPEYANLPVPKSRDFQKNPGFGYRSAKHAGNTLSWAAAASCGGPGGGTDAASGPAGRYKFVCSKGLASKPYKLIHKKNKLGFRANLGALYILKFFI